MAKVVYRVDQKTGNRKTTSKRRPGIEEDKKDPRNDEGEVGLHLHSDKKTFLWKQKNQSG